MKNKQPNKKVIQTEAEMFESYKAGKTMDEIGKVNNVSRERIRQLLRRYKPDFSINSYKGKVRIPRIERKCVGCTRTFQVWPNSQKEFHSAICWREANRVAPSGIKFGTSEHKKWKLARARERAHHYYHNVFKKLPNHKEITRRRNEEYAKKHLR